jgi:hypothetical protein
VILDKRDPAVRQIVHRARHTTRRPGSPCRTGRGSGPSSTVSAGSAVAL